VSRSYDVESASECRVRPEITHARVPRSQHQNRKEANMTTYTLCTPNDSGDHVIARGLTGVDALNHIVARAEKLDYQVCVEGYEDFCRY
jgi:hypothetical protein